MSQTSGTSSTSLFCTSLKSRRLSSAWTALRAPSNRRSTSGFEYPAVLVKATLWMFEVT